MAGSTTASFTQGEIDLALESVLSDKVKAGEVTNLDSFDSPVLDYMLSRSKELGASVKDGYKFMVKGRTGQRIQWWDGADLLTFGNPQNLSSMVFKIGRGHLGIEMLYQYLQYSGITVDYSKGVREGDAGTRQQLQVLVNVIKETFENARNDWKHDMIRRFWRSNSDAPKCFTGVDGLFPATGNTTGTIGGRPRSNPLFRHNLVTGITASNFQLSFHKLVKQSNDYQKKGKVEIFAVGDDVWDMIVTVFSGTDTVAGKFDWRATTDRAMKKGEKYNVALPQECFMYEDAIIYRAKEFHLDLAAEEPAASPTWQKRIYGFNPSHFGIVPVMDQKMIKHDMPYNQRLERTSMHGEYVEWTDHPRSCFVGVMT